MPNDDHRHAIQWSQLLFGMFLIGFATLVIVTRGLPFEGVEPRGDRFYWGASTMAPRWVFSALVLANLLGGLILVGVEVRRFIRARSQRGRQR